MTADPGRGAPLRSHRHPLWRKAPGRLFHHPVSFTALAIGALLVVISAAAYPFFVSASQSELLTSGIHAPTVSRYAAGLTYRSTLIPLDEKGPDGGPLYQERGTAFADAAAASPQLDPVVAGIFGASVEVTLPGGVVPASGEVSGRLFAGDGALDHLRVISGAEGDGVWLPDIIAEPAGVGPGDTVELRLHGVAVPVTVDGVYRGLYSLPSVGYFQPFNDDFYPAGCFECPVPPQPIVMDPAQLLRIATSLGEHVATFAWQAPVRASPPLTMEQARAVSRFAENLLARMERHGTPLGQAARCCGFWRYPGGGFVPAENVFRTAMPDIVKTVEGRSAASQAPILVLSVAALVIAMAVVAAAAAFSFASRRVEAGVLTARGWGPGAVSVKSALESLAPILVGAVAGFLGAAALIALVGPNGQVDAAAQMRALRASALATIVAIAVVAIVSGASYVARHERRERVARAVLWVPWELLGFGVASLLYRRLEIQGGLVESGGLLRPGAAVFLFPLALSLGVGILAARVMVFALTRQRTAGRRTGISAWFMAERRLSSSSRLTALFLVASTMSLAVFASAQAMASSLRATVDAKAGVFVGSDVQVRIGLLSEPDAAGYPFPVTSASRVRDAGAIGGTEQRFDLVAVDPATLEGAAFWDEAFSAEPLGTLLDRLAPPAPGAPLPIVVSNGEGLSFDTIDLANQHVPVEITGRTSSFPGTSSEDRPLVVVSRDVLETYFHTGGQPNPLNVAQGATELWIRGPASEVLATVAELGVLPLTTLTADDVKDIPFIDAAIGTFVMLNILGIAALALVLVVAVVYLQARQRARVLGAALSARMGMSSALLRRSLVVELGVVLGIALVIGGLVGIISVGVVVPTLDPLPTVPPDPLILRPWWALAAAGLALTVASLIGGALAARAARGVSLGEVMRAAE
ncbi:MAG: FtsX-like permease family protein [Actinomycetota bacterium]